jgi:hypothetical protein
MLGPAGREGLEWFRSLSADQQAVVWAALRLDVELDRAVRGEEE